MDWKKLIVFGRVIIILKIRIVQQECMHEHSLVDYQEAAVEGVREQNSW